MSTHTTKPATCIDLYYTLAAYHTTDFTRLHLAYYEYYSLVIDLLYTQSGARIIANKLSADVSSYLGCEMSLFQFHRHLLILNEQFLNACHLLIPCPCSEWSQVVVDALVNLTTLGQHCAGQFHDELGILFHFHFGIVELGKVFGVFR